jgi:hypothetical protein
LPDRTGNRHARLDGSRRRIAASSGIACGWRITGGCRVSSGRSHHWRARISRGRLAGRAGRHPGGRRHGPAGRKAVFSARWWAADHPRFVFPAASAAGLAWTDRPGPAHRHRPRRVRTAVGGRTRLDRPRSRVAPSPSGGCGRWLVCRSCRWWGIRRGPGAGCPARAAGPRARTTRRLPRIAWSTVAACFAGPR